MDDDDGDNDNNNNDNSKDSKMLMILTNMMSMSIIDFLLILYVRYLLLLLVNRIVLQPYSRETFQASLSHLLEKHTFPSQSLHQIVIYDRSGINYFITRFIIIY